MRSAEGAGGPERTVAARSPCGTDKLSTPDGQFRRESPRREPETPPASSLSCGSGVGKPREEKKTALSKVVIRRLPPGLTQEQLQEQLRPLPAHDYFEFFSADLSLYPHLYSRAYINFRNPDDILLFRDRFDGYIFIDSKGLEYPAVVEFAPFQKVAKKKPKKKDAKTGSIEDARRTTPLLEYIKNRKLEKQRIREEKREERRRRELEKKRLREEEKRKRREEERCKRKEEDKQKKTTEKEIRIKHRGPQTAPAGHMKRCDCICSRFVFLLQNKLLKKLEKGEEPTTEKPREREEIDVEDGKHEARAACAVGKARPLEICLEEPREKSQNVSDKEHRDMDRRSREKEPEAQRQLTDDNRKHRAHRQLGGLSGRSEDEPRWGKASAPDREKEGGWPARQRPRGSRRENQKRAEV
ncbi:regulator of nonsense transcripts 3A isoform X2 [Nycticebus coucang]|uniref:regulator of nonsense transcripts 3A isoform X2 n=1 Tax=Nycticebus coucang TaxID=9470 RepID=UPI00234C5DA6|nr:regulator of nonsense transcripts 3A isoform X2 [Nycticebus coucang]